jgi:hypothetical protein
MHCYPLFWKPKEKKLSTKKRSLLNVKHIFPFPFPFRVAPFCFVIRSTRVAGIVHFFRLERDTQLTSAARKAD